MRFWDASAIIPLCVDEPNSARVRALHAADPGMVVWWGCVVECWSAFARQRRDRGLDIEGEEAARAVLAALAPSWVELQPGGAVRTQAGRLLRLHPLRPSDALQLSAALVWAGGEAAEIVALDRRLRDAARLEGLRPVP
ncbi:MAG: type II toxin-antitoxin system VapC family toxin [Armatimonadota bacterium]|nr:type II toxin-antitoxin system VapC family toxin [Armatimonadota bacterium]MDR7421267.1 type II toxin-antitoxin system VapC family toxin [Armatimonadota bacterium]MDR7455288.1 type II toxin-antitoxin system VapC family toxin [Armatimonadota bacterium]MDR7455810.1 type II toxin-antitoxin system VapC family toxin [Armatimonadota bacterium]MDR7497917.1 type II toxin-antitoxin system VapC family toxin [Armatimonadota bacterium]